MFNLLRANPPADQDTNGTVVLDDSVMRRSDALREMLAFARAILDDGEVSDGEARSFSTWIQTNPDLRGLQGVDEIVELMTNVFADGHVSEPERTMLAEALERFSG